MSSKSKRGKNKECDGEKIRGEIKTENFPSSAKDINLQVEDAQ